MELHPARGARVDQLGAVEPVELAPRGEALGLVDGGQLSEPEALGAVDALSGSLRA